MYHGAKDNPKKRELKAFSTRLLPSASPNGAKENPKKRELKVTVDADKRPSYAWRCKGKSQEKGIERITLERLLSEEDGVVQRKIPRKGN